MKKYKERFVDRREDGCWWWLGQKDKAGYGYLRPNRKRTAAHRYFYTLYNADIPEGLDVLHSCDNPSCVNPEHLRVGTHSENMLEAYRKGRKTQSGVNNGNYRHGRRTKDVMVYE